MFAILVTHELKVRNEENHRLKIHNWLGFHPLYLPPSLPSLPSLPPSLAPSLLTERLLLHRLQQSIGHLQVHVGVEQGPLDIPKGSICEGKEGGREEGWE